MTPCFLIPKPKIVDDRAIVIRRVAAIGDAICCSAVCDKLAEKGIACVFQTHANIQCVMRRIRSVTRVEAPSGFAHVNLDGAYEKDPARRQKHFDQMFFEKANQQLRHFGINIGLGMNCKPRMIVEPADRAAALLRLKDHPKPWVLICPRSNSYTTRQVPDGIWESAAAKINGTKFWIGTHPAPNGIVDLNLHHLDLVISVISAGDLLVTVDTGPMHIAAALGIPVVAIGQSSSPDLHLSDQNDFVSISPPLPCLGCMENVCPKNQWIPPCQHISPEIIALTVNERLNRKGVTSAVVAIYQPDESVLNRCLAALVDQVDEIIVASDKASVVPSKAMRHPKIQYVQSRKFNTGYSGKANFGARHARGEWLLFINDDCFLAAGAVARMHEAVRPDTGVVSNLLRYPDGTIYHAGKIRSPGVRGWGHIDYKHHVPTYKTVTEIENCCGCCVLTRREVFYQAGCYDEELPLFAQDDAYALCVRRAGWKILFTPFSEGIHMEHQSVKKTGNIMDLVAAANRVFNAKWGGYLEHNLNRIPGNFSY